MKAVSLTTLCTKYLATVAKAKDIEAKAKPLADAAKQLQDQILERMQAEKLTVHQKGKVIALIEQKTNSVSWAGEYLKECGPEKVEAAKAAAGTKTVVKITTVG